MQNKEKFNGVTEKFTDKPDNISVKTAQPLPHTGVRWLPPCAGRGKYKKEAKKVAHFSRGAVAGHTAS